MNRKIYKKPKIWMVSSEVTDVIRTSGDTLVKDYDVFFVK